MKSPWFRTAAALALFGAVPASALAQPGAYPGVDVALGILGSLDTYSRAGTFPNGHQSFGMSTTSCNLGSVNAPWFAPMNAVHPTIWFILARESNGRLVQISRRISATNPTDPRPYGKHGFFALSNSQCTPCQQPSGGQFLGVGCSDTYGSSLNADHYWLGPPWEVNPWAGTWVPTCSHFDKGDPPVALAQQCDGARSLSQTQANTLNAGVNHRLAAPDSELNVAGSTFWYQGYYVISSWTQSGGSPIPQNPPIPNGLKNEPDSARDNNMASRQFIPTWTGASWATSEPGSQLYGTVLQRWNGATVTSATNGVDDGKVYVGVKVTGPLNGLWHHEYAFHNRDNNHGISAFRIPICPDARVLNVGFRDPDGNATNDWTFAKAGGEISWSTTNNPLYWNTIYNVWFDSDAAPVTMSSLTLDEFMWTGPAGGEDFTVSSTAPLGLYNVYLGDGCGTPSAPRLFAVGSPARASLGNATFGLGSDGNAAGAPVLLFGGTVDGTQLLSPGCNLYMGGMPPAPVFYFGQQAANAFGGATFSMPVPADPALEGTHLNFQAFEVQVGTGQVSGVADASNGLRVRIGSLVTDCP
jgi:hypothetical protein